MLTNTAILHKPSVREDFFASTLLGSSAIQVPQVGNEVLLQGTLRVGVQSPDDFIGEMAVCATEVGQVRTGRVVGESIDPVDVSSRNRGVNLSNLVEADGSGRERGAPEVAREFEVAEEECRVGHVEPRGSAIRDTAVHEEGIGERCLCISSEEAKVPKIELGVGRDRLLNAVIAELGGDRHVVQPSTVHLAEVRELIESFD